MSAVVVIVSEATIPTEHGVFRSVVFESSSTGEQHIAFVKGDLSTVESPLVRVHSECLTGDIFASLRCDCGSQLHAAMKVVETAAVGVVLYLRGQEGRGIGLGAKIQAYSLQDQGYDTVDANIALGFPADGREYHEAAEMLKLLEISSLRLLTNNPAKKEGLESFGLQIQECVPVVIPPTEHNLAYLQTKKVRMGHQLDELG